MNLERILPTEPLAFIQKCVTAGKVLWTYHVNIRLQSRFISRQDILDSVSSYSIIEEYPEDKYLPSYLVYCFHEGRIFHVLFAADAKEDHVRIITAYSPNPGEWEDDFKTRRKKL